MKILNIPIAIILLSFMACQAPPPVKKSLTVKHNYIILLDLSDRLIVQPEQAERDKEIVKAIYQMFEEQVKKDLYIKSRDEIKVVIAPQKGSGLRTDIFEDELYVNMASIKKVLRRPKEAERREKFNNALDDLYTKAVFSNVPEDYYGADIWKYFYEDLNADLSRDTLTKNYLIILTDGYPIVGKDLSKLQPVKDKYPDLDIILMEVSPREKDMEWDHIMEMWKTWFDSMNIENYTFIKRKAISKELEQVKEIVTAKK
jgi:hypothetical protein